MPDRDLNGEHGEAEAQSVPPSADEGLGDVPLRPVAPLGAGQIGQEEEEAVLGVLRDRVLYRYDGSHVRAFEDLLAEWLRAPVHVLALNSGSTALVLALAALDLPQGFEAILPTVGYVTAATAIRAAGGVARFAPVDRSLGLDVARVERLITDRTRVLVIVHPSGAPCNLSAATELARRHGLALVEDACQAAGATYDGAPVGTFGDVAALSFQYFKLVSTGEGGALVTKHRGTYANAAFMHDAALNWVDPKLVGSARASTIPPLNFRMSELEGALGCVQLGRADELVGELRDRQAMLRDAVSSYASVDMRPSWDDRGDSGTHLVFYVPNRETATKVVDELRSQRVNANLLLADGAKNRHWAGDWGPILAASDIDSPTKEVLDRDRGTLGPGIVVPVDLRYSRDGLGAACEALEQALARI